jgi:hypothetical protein
MAPKTQSMPAGRLVTDNIQPRLKGNEKDGMRGSEQECGEMAWSDQLSVHLDSTKHRSTAMHRDEWTARHFIVAPLS